MRALTPPSLLSLPSRCVRQFLSFKTAAATMTDHCEGFNTFLFKECGIVQFRNLIIRSIAEKANSWNKGEPPPCASRPRAVIHVLCLGLSYLLRPLASLPVHFEQARSSSMITSSQSKARARAGDAGPHKVESDCVVVNHRLFRC